MHAVEAAQQRRLVACERWQERSHLVREQCEERQLLLVLVLVLALALLLVIRRGTTMDEAQKPACDAFECEVLGSGVTFALGRRGSRWVWEGRKQWRKR